MKTGVIVTDSTEARNILITKKTTMVYPGRHKNILDVPAPIDRLR